MFCAQPRAYPVPEEGNVHPIAGSGVVHCAKGGEMESKRRRFSRIGPEIETSQNVRGPAWWARRALTVFVLVGIAGAGILDLRPGAAGVWGTAPLEDAARAVVVSGHPYRAHRGGLYITAVGIRRATELERLAPAVLAWSPPPDATLVTLRQLYGSVTPTQSQEARVERRQMLDSQTVAAIAAYRALGYPVPLVRGQPRLPYRTTFRRDPLAGGGSAGFMLALAIVDRFGDVTRGHTIAGTGTIAPNGDIGPIGGARFKIVGARRAGAQFFLVPARWDPYHVWYGSYASNYEEARRCRCAGAMRLVPVRTLTDALAFLRTLH